MQNLPSHCHHLSKPSPENSLFRCLTSQTLFRLSSANQHHYFINAYRQPVTSAPSEWHVQRRSQTTRPRSRRDSLKSTLIASSAQEIRGKPQFLFLIPHRPSILEVRAIPNIIVGAGLRPATTRLSVDQQPRCINNKSILHPRSNSLNPAFAYLHATISTRNLSSSSIAKLTLVAISNALHCLHSAHSRPDGAMTTPRKGHNIYLDSY